MDFGAIFKRAPAAAPAAAPKMDMTAVGSAGLKHAGGYVTEEWLPELAGRRGMAVYREMSDNDAIVGAVVFAISMLVRQVEWTTQAADETPEAESAKEFLDSVFEDMSTPLADIMDEVTTMFPYGYAPLEIVWKRRQGQDNPDEEARSDQSDGAVGIREIALRSQETITRWELDPETDNILGVYQQPWSGPEVFIPIEKMLLFRTTKQRSNPEGRSILRTAYKSWYFKKKLEAIEAIGVERDLAGLPVAYIPSQYMAKDADANDKAVFAMWRQLVTRIKRDQQEGIIMPSDRDKDGNLLYELKLLSSGGSRTFDTTKIIDRYNRAIATSTLADFIFLGQTAVGSFALSSDKTALFATAIGGFVTVIEGVFNRHLIPRLWALNSFDPAVMPKLKAGDIEKQNLAELAAFVTSMSGAGVPLFPDRELENYLRKVAGLPEAPEDGTAMPTPQPGDGSDPNADGAGTDPEADQG